MKVLTKEYGVYNGKQIYEYELINDLNTSIKVINYGATITEVNMADRQDSMGNVVLGYDSFEEYLNNNMYLGTTVGRVAGRISNSGFTLDGATYKLPTNNIKSCLHGGFEGFDKKVWDTDVVELDNQVKLIFRYHSVDMEEGFPGNLSVVMEYSLDNNNDFTIEYSATTDKATPITLTNHTYWNLSGNIKEPILNHRLQLSADEYITINNDVTPNSIQNVENTPFDFRIGKIIKDNIDLDNEQIKIASGYDHPFIFNDASIDKVELYDENSGRLLQIETTEPCIVIYSAGTVEDKYIINGGKRTYNYCGIALETQGYPDAVNKGFPGGVLNPGELYTSTTTYKLRTLK